MKLHLLPLLLACAVTAPLFRASADPILPYQNPIAQQLMSDIEEGSGDVTLYNRALDAFHARSRSLRGDISILRNLHNLLADQPNYGALLAEAANNYLGDFQGRSAALADQLRPAARTSTKSIASTLLAKLNRALANAAAAESTGEAIGDLKTAAARLQTASNTVQRALRAARGFSSVGARIGVLNFSSGRGFVLGGTNFQSSGGTALGAFDAENGILSFGAVDPGPVARSLSFYVTGVSTETPATYPLGMGENIAFYRATDVPRRREYLFNADASLTNSTVPNAFLTIDFIGTNYLLGRFAFLGTNSNPAPGETNTVVTVSAGEFQLNLNR